MFGKRSGAAPAAGTEPARTAPAAPSVGANLAASHAIRSLEMPEVKTENRRSDEYYHTKSTIFGALIEAIDLAQLSRLEPDAAREEIRDIVSEIIALKNLVMSIAEQEELLDDICNDVLGYGPLEPLLARDDIADIMASGSSARSGAGSTNRRRSATRVCRTARAST